jgi:hypothetical protein
MVEKVNSLQISQAELEILRVSPAFQMACKLLEKVLEIKTSDLTETLEISQVEPFPFLLDNAYGRLFDAKTRQKGELFITSHRGNAQINLVVDPKSRSVVWIKEFKNQGEPISASKIINLLRLDKKTFPSNQEYQSAVIRLLDGLQVIDPQTESPLQVKDPEKKESPVLNIRRTIKDQIAENSLGTFRKE